VGGREGSGIVDVAGVRVLLEADDERQAAVVGRVLRLLPSASPPYDVDVHYAARRPVLPSRPADKANKGFRVWFDGDVFCLEVPSGARARVTPTSASLGSGDDDAASAFEFLFPAAITHLLAFQGRFILHAGGVVGERGAYPLVGATGTGKSTLAAAALEHGWRLLGDDMIVIRSGDDGLEAAGVPRRVAVPAHLGFRWAGRPIPNDRRGRLELPAEMLEAGWFPLGGTIVVGHGSDPATTVRRISGLDNLRAVLGAYRSSVNPAHLRRFFPVAAALSRLPAWALLHGTDPASRLAEAGRALALLAEASGTECLATGQLLP
jgi:hypothetical protein